MSTTAHLEGDRELDCTRYAYLLSTRVAAPSNHLLLYQLEATAIAALAVLLKDGVHNGLLPYDVQILLARYTTDGDAIDDAVSGLRCFARTAMTRPT